MTITDSLASLIISLSKSFRQWCLDLAFRELNKREMDFHLDSLYGILFQTMRFEVRNVS